MGRHSERRKYLHGKRQTVGRFIPAETSMRMRQTGQGVVPRIACRGETRSYDPRRNLETRTSTVSRICIPLTSLTDKTFFA